MASLVVRPATSTDLPALTALDHGYTTEYVWQMESREEDGQTSVNFRRVRLPRSMRVLFPRDPKRLASDWTRQAQILAAEQAGQLRGYLALSLGPAPGAGWVADFAVERRHRRQGVGTALLAAAVKWARENGLRRLVVETQSKNFPAISFCQKNGLVFCGYNDRYYANQDIALFFGLNLR